MIAHAFEASHAANPANVANRGASSSRSSHDSRDSRDSHRIPLPATATHSHDSQHSHALDPFHLARQSAARSGSRRANLAAGADDLLCRFLRALAPSQLVGAGIVPDGWTCTAACAGCTAVPLWPYATHSAIACACCGHRQAGRVPQRAAWRLST